MLPSTRGLPLQRPSPSNSAVKSQRLHQVSEASLSVQAPPSWGICHIHSFGEGLVSECDVELWQDGSKFSDSELLCELNSSNLLTLTLSSRPVSAGVEHTLIFASVQPSRGGCGRVHYLHCHHVFGHLFGCDFKFGPRHLQNFWTLFWSILDIQLSFFFAMFFVTILRIFEHQFVVFAVVRGIFAGFRDGGGGVFVVFFANFRTVVSICGPLGL